MASMFLNKFNLNKEEMIEMKITIGFINTCVAEIISKFSLDFVKHLLLNASQFGVLFHLV